MAAPCIRKMLHKVLAIAVMLPTWSQSLLETKFFQSFWGILLEFLVCVGRMPSPCHEPALPAEVVSLSPASGQWILFRQQLWTKDEVNLKLPSSGNSLVVQQSGLRVHCCGPRFHPWAGHFLHLPKNSRESLYLSPNFVENLKLP